MLKKTTTKLAALFVALCMALTLAPFAAFAEEPTETPTDASTEATSEAATSEPTEDSGEEATSEPTESTTEAATEATTEAATQDPTDPVTTETDPATPTDAVTITVAEGEPLYIPQGEPVTDAALLAGVSAADENGNPVAVTVADTGGLARDNPQPGGEPGSPEPYIITYAAEGAESVTRECFVTVGVMPLASTATAIDLNDTTTTSGTNWTYDSATKVFTVNNGANVTISGTVTDETRVVVSGTAAITLDGASITYAGITRQSALQLSSGAILTLYLKGTNTLSGTDAGLQAGSGTELTIDGDGTLSCEGSNGAGIGGGHAAGGGTITINGGEITATTRAIGNVGGGAGIGGGNGGDGGMITISGNAVIKTAEGSNGGAGIGGGKGGSGGKGGTIVIGGNADVTAIGSNGGAGIGGGQNRDSGTITINGGNVTAKGGANAADIGGGGSGGDVDGDIIINVPVNADNIGPGEGGAINGGSILYADPVIGVELDKTTLPLTLGGATETLNAMFDPINATHQAVTWVSDDTAVATVDGNGVVTPVAVGSATITVTTNDGGFTDICEVAVAASNNPPKLKDDVSAITTATVPVSTFYPFDLSQIFEDEDGDSLTYWSSLDGDDYIELPGPRFTAASTSTVTHTLVFKANDGMVDSIDTYTVELTWIQPAVTFTSQGVVDLARPTDLVYTADQPGLLTGYDPIGVRFDIDPTLAVSLEYPTNNYNIPMKWENGTLTIDKSIFDKYLEQSKIAEQQGAPMPSLVAGAYKVTIIFDNGWEYSTTSALTGAFPEPLETYTITYNNGGGSGTMSSGTATEGVAFTLPDCTFTPPADKEFKAWLIGGVEYAEGAKYTFTAATTVTAVWKDEAVTPPPVNNDPPEEPTSPSWRPSSDDDNDDDSTYTAPRLPALTEQWMTAANLTNPSRSTLRFGVRVSAWNALTGQYYHDSIRGKIVEARTYFENPGLFTRDSYVSGWTNGADVDKNRALFEKWYTNPIRAIHFDQPGKWENPIKVAARVDLAGMDTTRLVFYYYDPKLNSYRKLAAPAYWVDANGYLRFQTEYAGEIIISEGELEKK